MQDEPAGLTRHQVAATLRSRWGVGVQTIEYAPVGFGSHHWRVLDDAGRRWFVTADQPSNVLGGGLDAAANEAALLAAYETASALSAAGLDFIVAPLATTDGKVIAYPAPDWCVALFPHVEGVACGNSTWDSAADLTRAVSLVGRLHSMQPPGVTQPWSGTVPNRSHLEAALAALDLPWNTGPYAEPTRQSLAGARTTVETQLARYDRLAQRVIAMPDPWVITHGEPHQANFIKTLDRSLHLIDWGTARLGPRERDLWMLLEGGSGLDAYRATAGDYTPRPEAIALFGLLWQLTDLSIYIHRFRETHGNGEDDAKSFWGVEQTLTWLAELPSG